MEIITSIPILRTPSVELQKDIVQSADFQIRLDDMYETMRKARGVGLAAIQVGVPQRVFIIDSEDADHSVFINPVILEKRGREVKKEACLSLPGVYVNVPRATRIVLKAQDRLFQEFELVAKDEGARILQHELDHLDGILIIDKTTPAERVTLGLK